MPDMTLAEAADEYDAQRLRMLADALDYPHGTDPGKLLEAAIRGRSAAKRKPDRDASVPVPPPASPEAAGELAALADQLALRAAEVRGVTAGQSHRERQMLADLIERHAAALRAHRCAPAGPEIVSGAEAAELPVGSAILDVQDDRLGIGPYANVRTGPGSLDWSLRAPMLPRDYRVLYRVPEPAKPLEVGDPVRTSAQIAVLPVGAVVRPRTGGVAERYPDGWSFTDGSRVLATVPLPARILDLPNEETS